MDISDTLKKVEKALDLRFERDSSLYISKEDTESIKQSLYNSKYQNINAFIKKFGNKIVVKIILSNSWLINFNKNRYELKNIFDNVDKDFLKEVAKDVIEDNIFSTTEFKLFIKQYYLEGSSIKDCSKIYENTQEIIQNRVTCFSRYLKEKYILENNSSNIVRFIDSEFKKYPEIYDFIQSKNSNFLSSILNDYNDINLVLEWIIENKITDRHDKVWNNLFLLKKEIALEQLVEYISNNPSWDNSITKYLIQRVLVKLNKVDEFKDSILELYDNHYGIRLLFLHMIEPPRFKDKDLAQSLLEEFNDIGLPNKSESSVEKIRNWDEKDNTNSGFESKDEIINVISDNKHNFHNMKTLSYYSFKLNKTEKQIILDIFYNYSFNENLKLLLSYYLATFLTKRDIPKHFNDINNPEYIVEITNFIEKLNINTKHSKKFLEINNNYELLSKFNKR